MQGFHVAVSCWIIVEMIGMCVVCDDRVSATATVGAPVTADDDVVVTVAGDMSPNRCSVSAIDPLTNAKIKQFLKEKVSLIEYRLDFANYTVSPLATNVTVLYAEHKWSRVTTTHGQTLLSLAFNYGVLSMMTLTMGTVRLDVTLADSPPGCLATVAEVTERMDIVLRLLMRDFDGSSASGPLTLGEDERICHDVVIDREGVADFRDRCCFRDVETKTNAIACTSNIGNFWLSVIYGLLCTVRICLLFFGPVLFIDIVNGISCGTTPYIVKLKESLVKTVLVCYSEDEVTERQRSTSKRIVDMRSLGRFPKLAASAERIPMRQPCRVRFKQYDINVACKRTMTENAVEVGLMRTLIRLMFRCHVRHVGSLRTCCAADMMTGCGAVVSQNSVRRRVPWINFWRHVSHFLLVVLLPLPYYIRLAVFYTYEETEVLRRKEATSVIGLRESFDGSLLLYLTPTHPVFIVIYFIYFLTSLLMAFAPNRKVETLFGTIVYGSFKDLASLDWTDPVDVIVSNVTWPLERFGALGCLVGLVYWPIVVPLTLLVSTVYLVPTIYITCRMVAYSLMAAHVKSRQRKNTRRYQAMACTDRSVRWFRIDKHFPARPHSQRHSQPQQVAEDQWQVDEFDALDHPCDLDYVDHIKKPKPTTSSIASSSSVVVYATLSFVRISGHVCVAVVCVLNVCSMSVILSEVVGCVIEVAVFTVMGVVVNASELLKYVMLFLMIFVHICDCFNSVEKKYLKLNKALFAEVKARIRDLSDVTSLPSSLQENRGFKGQELNEQASYESPDDIAECPPRHWMINDLILFVDSEDTPRIPKQLFNQVCDIHVAGVPGPVFRGQIQAIVEVLKVGAFLGLVFLVVLSFSAVYKLSTTNQMLATVVGGFLPMILKTFVKSPATDVELGTVSFRSKMDEVIKNFCQYWPIYDLPFELDVDDVEGESTPLGGDERTVTSSRNIDDAVRTRSAFDVAMDLDPEGILYANQLISLAIDDVVDCVTSFIDEKKSSRLPINNNNQKQKSESVASASAVGAKSLLVRTATGKKTVSLNVANGNGQESNAIEEELDILIYLPKKRGDLWLDEWSVYSA